jgi:hypothetical protein
MKNRRFPFLLLLVAAMTILTSWFGCVSAGVNSLVNKPSSTKPLFPNVEVSDLQGKSYRLPLEFRQEQTLLLIAFTGDQQSQVDTWLANFDGLVAKSPNLDFIEMPTIESSSAPFRAFVNNGMRSGIPDPVARARTWTLYTNRDDFLSHLQIKQMNQVYALLVERSGEILWMESGVSTPEKIASLLGAIQSK